jgi:hypothetical protein
MSDYTGTVDETEISALIVEIGKKFEAADDLGFVLTYHAAEGDGVGVMTLVGRGIDQRLLGVLLADALEANDAHGYTT